MAYSQSLKTSVANVLSNYHDLSEPAMYADRVTDVILATKGLVSDGMFQRQKGLVQESDSAVLALAGSLETVKYQLAELYVKGPEGDLSVYNSRMDSLARVADDLETELARSSASFRDFQDQQNVSSERIRSLLPENSVLVEYLRYDYRQLDPDSIVPRYLAVILRRSAEPVIVDIGEATPIESIVSDYREFALTTRMPTVAEFDNYRSTAAELSRLVWSPVVEYTGEEPLVLVAPDGALNLISFAGLPVEDGQYLIEKQAVHYLSAGRDLIRLQVESGAGDGLLAMGDPDFDASAEARSASRATSYATREETGRYLTRSARAGCRDVNEITVQSLPNTALEVERISDAWSRSNVSSCAVFVGIDASEDNFKRSVEGKQVAHLATHGYFLANSCAPESTPSDVNTDVTFVGENPLLLSGLLLAGSNLHGEGCDSVGIEDGILSAYEISAIDMTGLDLVVLSACETGLGLVENGEGVFGLRRAFLMSGARTVVSALWSVGDQYTAQMMSEFYSTTDETVPERMRRAQIAQIKELRDQGLPDHPLLWAGFIAIGDWR